MKLLYATDLHGDRRKYERMFKVARSQKVDIAINGGDMFPRSGNLFRQNKFISGYLRKYFARFEKAKIYYMACTGNDDLKIFDPLFEKICGQFDYIIPLAQKKFTVGGYDFIGMNWVSDYPFALKDRCRKDTQKHILHHQYGPAMLSTEKGFKMANWFEYSETLPTIEDELKKLPVPEDFSKAVYIIHMPPENLGLEHCAGGVKAGSGAIYEFIKEKQPLFSLHGHIHESPDISGKWFFKMGDTVCIQPGQGQGFSYVIIDLEKITYKRFVER